MSKFIGIIKPVLLLDLVRHFGPGWVFARGRHQWRLRRGHFRRKCPVGKWEQATGGGIFHDDTNPSPDAYHHQRTRDSPRFFFDIKQVDGIGCNYRAWDQEGKGPADEAESLARGRVTLFGGLELNTGFPPDWHRNHPQGISAPTSEHWSLLSDFAYGDIKLIWELSRFPFTFTFARAYARTGREEFAEAFWLAVEDWLAANPPQAGVNWKCGQEISLRLMAWCFGMYAFLSCPATNGKRLLKLARALSHFGRRIEANLDYALSQNNNHGVSEAAGLFTLGTLFPELRGSRQWRKLGRLHLEEQAGKLIYADGAFSQQSPNYHRLVLQLYTWALGVARLNGADFSPGLSQRLRAALNWSLQLMEPESGCMPSSGGHDGAHFLPLTNCAFGDHRPTLQALAYMLDGELLFEPGPWDEQVLWLCGPAALDAPRLPRAQADFWHGEGGFHVLRNSNSWAVLRCGPYLHRPVHADLLHLDLWWRGRNVAIDPGSYSYNPEGPWQKGLAGTEVHNTVSVAGRDQMGKAARFMWMPWAHSSLLGAKRSPGGHLAWLEGTHSGYRRFAGGPLHRRSVLSINGQWWLVLDFVVGGEHSSRLHWLLADAPHQWDPAATRLSLAYPEGGYQVEAGAGVEAAAAELVRADPASPRGWCSPTYQVQREALSLFMSAPPGNPLYFSALGPAGFSLERRGEDFILTTKQFQAQIQLRPAVGPVLVSSGLVVLEGENEDRLSFP